MFTTPKYKVWDPKRSTGASKCPLWCCFFSHHLQVSGDELGLLGGSCCFALPQLVEGPTREQPNTPRATLFAGRLASSCRHWFWLLEFDMDVIWCYVGFVHIFSLNLLDIPQNLPGILQLVNAPLLLKRLERGICGMTTNRVSGAKEYVGQKPPKLLWTAQFTIV